MTPYTVDWTTDAEDTPTLIWLRTQDPDVTAASNRIDQRLGRDPFGCGTHVQEGLYRLVERPLTVSYSIDQGKKTVEVSAVRYTS